MDVDRSGDLGHLFHLVLYADPDECQPYLMELLTGLLVMPHDTALRRLADLATKGRAVLMTCQRDQAELAREQIETYRASTPAPVTKTPVRIAVERVYARPN